MTHFNTEHGERGGAWLVLFGAFLCLAVILSIVAMSGEAAKPSRDPPARTNESRRAGVAGVAQRAVSDYFDALGEANAGRRMLSSMGELRAWASWVDSIPHGKLLPPELEIERFYYLRGGHGSASVAFEATNASVGDGSYEYRGPVSVVETDRGWKVSNYFRNGRSQTKAVFDDVSVDVTSDLSLRVEVEGAVLQDDYTNLFVEIDNTSAERILLTRPELWIPRGKARGYITSTSVAKGDRRPLSLFWRISLPLDTRRLRTTLYGRFPGESRLYPIRLDLTLNS